MIDLSGADALVCCVYCHHSPSCGWAVWQTSIHSGEIPLFLHPPRVCSNLFRFLFSPVLCTSRREEEVERLLIVALTVPHACYCPSILFIPPCTCLHCSWASWGFLLQSSTTTPCSSRLIVQVPIWFVLLLVASKFTSYEKAVFWGGRFRFPVLYCLSYFLVFVVCADRLLI